MILLDRQTMMPHKRFAPESMSLTLEERKSSASIQLGPDDPEIAVGAWLTDDSGPGAGIVWRAKTVDEQFDTGTRTVTLEHIINTLKDDVIFGEFTYEDIAGEGATGCYAHQMVSFILDQQSIWQLGDFDYMEVTNPYKFDDVTLFSALETITGSLEDAYWAYDMSTFPFTLHIKHIPNEVTCEMRPGRNIQTMKRTIDRSRMYTRLFPIGKDDLNITGDYLSKNEEIYGTICAIKTDQKYETENELLGWAQDLLNRHCEPTVTITISGLELSESTGEPLDHLTLMRKCRVPLPEFGTTIAEKITKLQWSNVVKEPEKVTVTLGNEMEDIASIINSTNEAVSGGGGGSTDAKNAGEDHAWFVDTDTHVQMIAEAIIGKDEDGVNWSRVASITVDGEGIHQRVTRALGYMVVMDAKIDLNEERLRAEFEDVTASLRSELQMSAASLRIEFTDEANGLRGELQMSAASLRVEFEDSNASLRSELQMTAASLRIEFENSEASLRSAITQEAGRIGLVVEGYGSDASVKSAAIIAAVTDENGVLESSITVDAEKVYIGNTKSTTVIAGKCTLADVTADYIKTQIASLAVVNVALLSSERGGIDVYSVNTTSYTQGDVVCYVPHAITALNIDLTGNIYTLQYKRFADDSWQSVPQTFSRATTLSGAWASGVFTVSASPQGDTKTTSLTITNVHRGVAANNENTNHYYGNVSATIDSGQTVYNTGKTFEVDASAVWDSCYNSLSVTAPNAGSLGYEGSAQVIVKLTDSSGTEQTIMDRTYTSPADRYNIGFDAAHTSVIGGTAGDASDPDKKTAITLGYGETVSLWPYWQKSNSAWAWGTKCTVGAPSFPSVGSVTAGSSSGTSLGSISANKGQYVRFYVGSYQYCILLT